MTEKISILTPSFNQGQFIEQTIRSVLDQDHADVEHIVIDGGSTDQTLDVLRRYPHLTWLSERDHGQADALNKALSMASGDIVGWINSDDFYRSRVFGSVVRHFRASAADWVIGNVSIVNGLEQARVRPSPAIDFASLASDPDIVRQQATFFRRSVLLAVGGWNAEFFMAMDYDLWMRLVRRFPPLMVDEHWASFRAHPEQKSTAANILRQAAEIARIQQREGVAPRLITQARAKKRWYSIKGAIKKRLIDMGVLPQRFRARPLRPG